MYLFCLQLQAQTHAEEEGAPEVAGDGEAIHSKDQEMDGNPAGTGVAQEDHAMGSREADELDAEVRFLHHFANNHAPAIKSIRRTSDLL